MESLNDSSQISDSIGILLWDIDGTLIRKLGESRFSRHLQALGINKSTESQDYAGLSDWDVLLNYTREYGISDNDLKKAFEKLNTSEDANATQLYQKLSGVEEILIETSNHGWRNGILTGNTYFSAIHKLQSTGLLNYFDADILFFCKAQESRLDIARRAKEILDHKVKPVIVIGDTEHDIKVAKEIGFSVISVPSGIRTREYLEKFQPNLILDSLKLEPCQFMKHLASLL